MDILNTEVEKIYSVFKSFELSSTVFNSDTEYLHQKRLSLDPFIFESLKRLYMSYFKEQWDRKPIPYSSDKTIVIVERRCHPNLEFILHNVAYFAPEYSIHIFCSKANLSFIETICGSQLNNIHIHTIFETIGTPEEGKIEYNNLLKSKSFWNNFSEEHILTIETDCYLMQEIPDSIYEYDYIASKWPWPESESEPGGGGLSYRKCSIMKQICDLDDISVKNTPMQDNFVSNGVKILGAKYSHSFFSEASILQNPIGTHQWWTFYNISEMPKKVIKHYLTLRLVDG